MWKGKCVWRRKRSTCKETCCSVNVWNVWRSSWSEEMGSLHVCVTVLSLLAMNEAKICSHEEGCSGEMGQSASRVRQRRRHWAGGAWRRRVKQNGRRRARSRRKPAGGWLNMKAIVKGDQAAAAWKYLGEDRGRKYIRALSMTRRGENMICNM